MEELRLDYIHEMYTSTILNQQIQYSILENKYNILLGNNYLTEEVDQKKQSIFKKAIEVIKRWIGKLITFITKTIPNWIKKQGEKIANLFKKKQHAKVVNVSNLPKKYQNEVKKLANSANNAVKYSRKAEIIKSQLNNSEDSDNYLVNSLRQMNADMQRQTDAAFDDLNKTEYDTAMNITDRHAKLHKLLKEVEDRQKKSEKEIEETMKNIDNKIAHLSDWDSDNDWVKKDKEIQKKQDQIDKDLDDHLNFSGSSNTNQINDISKELDSILDDINDSVKKKEDVVVVDTQTPKLKGYEGMDIDDNSISGDDIAAALDSSLRSIISQLKVTRRTDRSQYEFSDSEKEEHDSIFKQIEESKRLVEEYKKVVDKFINTPLVKKINPRKNTITVNTKLTGDLSDTKVLQEALKYVNSLDDNDGNLKSVISIINQAISIQSTFISYWAKMANFTNKVRTDFANNCVAVYE